MPESFDALRKTVLAEVRRQRKQPFVRHTRRKENLAKLMGIFLDVCLNRLGYTPQQFAHALAGGRI
jgi:hypothetical protein